MLLFALLAYTGLRIARRNSDPFIKIVASAGTVWLVGQACINIGYVVGLLPVTGIPLPMISAGGTSLLITMVVFGLLANFARREREAEIALAAAGGSRIAQFLGLRPHGPDGRKPMLRRRRRASRSDRPAPVPTGRRSAAPAQAHRRSARPSAASEPPGNRGVSAGRHPAGSGRSTRGAAGQPVRSFLCRSPERYVPPAH